MKFGILGQLEVTADSHTLNVRGAKQSALLAVLLLNANRVVSSDRLIDALWDEGPPDTARKALQVYVSQLRKLLGGATVVTRPPGYLLQVAQGGLDLDRFEGLVREARGAEPETAAAKLHEALSLWRGPPLADFAYDRFARPEIARLEELRLVALEERIEADLALGRHAELKQRDRVEEEAPSWLQPETYLEPFALRALGVVREDGALIGRAVAGFDAMGLDWHAAQTRALL